MGTLKPTTLVKCLTSYVSSMIIMINLKVRRVMSFAQDYLANNGESMDSKLGPSVSKRSVLPCTLYCFIVRCYHRDRHNSWVGNSMF